ncbi:MAG: hypothetical protein V3U50_06025 [Acidimicrobiia bacterium]
MRISRQYTLALAFVLITTACSVASDSTPIVTGVSPDGSIVVGDTAPPATPPPPPVCTADTPVVRAGAPNPSTEFFNEGPGLASVHISQATFECATQVVIVSDVDLNRVAIAAVLAAALKAPLLIGSANTAGIIGFEIERLAPGQIIAVGDDVTFTAPEWTEIITFSGDTPSLAEQINVLAGFDATIPLPEVSGAATLITTVNALEARAGLIPPVILPTTTTTLSSDQTSVTTVPPTPVEIEFEVPSLTAGAGETGVAILVDGNNAATALAAFATATASGAIASLVDSADLRAVPGAGRALQSIPGGAGSIQIFGEVTTDSHWQLDVIRSAEELPGGGFLVLPRILVALYGNPQTTALGALGEQGPTEAATRVQGMAAQFEAAEVPALPTFEIIATVAAGNPGGDGNYSNEMGNEIIQPWIDIGAQQDVYVVLDLQPGRSDFLTQAMRYEQELLNPHVGLALDPEWRLGPEQLPLQQIGRVQAAEVNQVVEWLANLVRENNLPQKVLLLHQFRDFMLQDRETIQAPPELQLIIQMDGQGAVPDKYVTWEFLTGGWEDHPWRWGWKNFYDEDRPGGGISPSDVLQLVPTAVYVSYQ